MAYNIETLSDLLAILNLALSHAQERTQAIKAFQRHVFDNHGVPGATVEQWDVLNEVALDLDYYEADPSKRQEDPSFYGDERLQKEIRETLEKFQYPAATKT
jgi:hypothetical protein